MALPEPVKDTCIKVWEAVPQQSRADLSRPALERGITEALERGWTKDATLTYLTRDLGRESLPAATVHSRLRELPAIDPPRSKVEQAPIPFDMCDICACGANVTLGHPHVAGCTVADLRRRPAPKPQSTVIAAGPEVVGLAVTLIRADLAGRKS